MSKELNTLAPKKWTANFGGVAPTLDTSDGILVGDVAIDNSTTPNKIWRCLDNTEGSPLWNEIDLMNWTGIGIAAPAAPLHVADDGYISARFGSKEYPALIYSDLGSIVIPSPAEGGSSSSSSSGDLPNLLPGIHLVDNTGLGILNKWGISFNGIPEFIINKEGAVESRAIQFKLDGTPLTNAEGLLQWNATDGTLDLGMSAGAITQQIGQELHIKAINKTASTIDNGTPVYFNGRQGDRPKIEPAKSDADATATVMGVTTQDIAPDAEGYITTFGYVRGIKTNYSGTGNWGTTWAAGDKLYISKTVAGQLTNVEPASPHHSDIVGVVGIVGGAGVGSIFVNIRSHSDLATLADVDGTALTTTGQIPVWDNSAGYFDFNYNMFNLPGSIQALSASASITGRWVKFTGSTASQTLTMPASSNGKTVGIRNAASVAVTIARAGSDTIEGETSIVLNPGESVTLVSFSADWTSF